MKAKSLTALILFALIGSAAYAVEVDGALAPNEYAREISLDKGNFRILWRIVEDRLYMAIDAKAAGWVSVGFEPTSVMANSDMIFGILGKDGALQAVDAWSTGTFGPHPPDASQGGSDSLLASAARRSGDRVVFEFSRLLATGDKFDRTIPAAGKFKVIWAYSSSLQFTARHSRGGSVILEMDGSR